MEAQYDLITRNLAEIIGKEELNKIIGTRPLKI
jgi:hypothetical protein